MHNKIQINVAKKRIILSKNPLVLMQQRPGQKLSFVPIQHIWRQVVTRNIETYQPREGRDAAELLQITCEIETLSISAFTQSSICLLYLDSSILIHFLPLYVIFILLIADVVTVIMNTLALSRLNRTEIPPAETWWSK